MQVTVKQGQTIFDIAIQTAGSVEAAFEAALLNGVSLTDGLTAGDALAVPPVADEKILRYYRDSDICPATALSDTAISENAGFSYLAGGNDFTEDFAVGQGQTILDIAIQTAGSIEAAFEAARLNGIRLTDDLTIGEALALPSVADKLMLQHFKDNRILPASGISAFGNCESENEGIGYWYIELDFRVS